MKKHITAIFLIILLLIFIIFITISNRYSTVYQVLSPTEIELLPQHKAKASNELLCITDIESFSLNPDEKFVKKYSKKYNLPYSDIVGLGFLAQDYSQKLLQNRRVTVKYSHKNTSSCSYAKIKLNGMDYAELLANSGFGITKGKIRNEEKFKQNLEKARKLNLVILNHHSGKYHTLDCPYGQVAHDSVIIPINQLPDGVKPCKFCHDVTNKNKQPLYKKATNIFNIPNIKKPLLSVFDDNIKMIFTDFTETLKPNNECSSDVCKALVTFINETQETLDIAIYGYENNPAITSALINAKARGVNIRFVYDRTYKDQNNHYKNNDIIENLSSAANSDISISATYSNMIMHNKFLISDNRKVFTGSMNISASGLSNFDVNNIIIINSKEVASLYTKEF